MRGQKNGINSVSPLVQISAGLLTTRLRQVLNQLTPFIRIVLQLAQHVEVLLSNSKAPRDRSSVLEDVLRHPGVALARSERQPFLFGSASAFSTTRSPSTA